MHINMTNEDSTTVFKRLNINNISTRFGNNGLSDYAVRDQGKGFRYPKNLPYDLIWCSGLIYGGKVNGNVRVCGTTYFSSMQPAGTKKIFRVRKDYKTSDLANEISDREGTETEIRSEYEDDWNNWPVTEGAPFKDVNNNGVYEPAVDIPGIPDADQTIWFKANDFDSTLTKYVFGSSSLDVEVQYTFWAYKGSTPLSNIIFRKYRLTNTGNEPIQNMYCSIFSDPDIGDVSNDLVGCDTSVNLAYAYNLTDKDLFLGDNTPTVGIALLKGPLVNGRSLGLSSFNPFINTWPPYDFPSTRSYENGALWFYNLFQGRLQNGNQYSIPQRLGGGETSFPLSGDPIDSTGWLDGVEIPPGNNRSMALSTGPFDLLPGESREVVFAAIAAGGKRGMTRNDAIDSLKRYARYAIDFYKSIDTVITDVKSKSKGMSTDYILYQNYPNPFNPITKISYRLPVSGHVLLKIYDALGREVSKLIDETKSAGSYTVDWNGSNYSSGIYFYSIRYNNQTLYKKMMMIK